MFRQHHLHSFVPVRAGPSQQNSKEGSIQGFEIRCYRIPMNLSFKYRNYDEGGSQQDPGCNGNA